MKNLVIGFTGRSGSGKTTLISALVRSLAARGQRVIVVKHDSKDEARFDASKDSAVHFDAGADCVLVSDTRTSVFAHGTSELGEILARAGEFDLLIIEGFKCWKVPRIGIFRGGWQRGDEWYLGFCDAVASDFDGFGGEILGGNLDEISGGNLAGISSRISSRNLAEISKPAEISSEILSKFAHLPRLNLNDQSAILAWIMANAIEKDRL